MDVLTILAGVDLDRAPCPDGRDRLHGGVDVPVDGYGNIRNNKAALRIRANADDFIRISGQFEVDAESASVFRDKADLRIRQRLTIAKQSARDSSAIRECD